MYAQTKSVITVYCVKVAYSYTPNQCIEKNEIMSLNLCVAFRTILPHFESSPFPLHSAGVHFAFLGRPLVGDLTYGRCSPNEVFNDHQRLTFEYWSKFESTMLWRNHETISFSGLLNSDCVFLHLLPWLLVPLKPSNYPQAKVKVAHHCPPGEIARWCARGCSCIADASASRLCPKKGGFRRTKLTEFVGPFLPQLIMPYVGIHSSLQISLRGIKQTWRDLAFGNRFQQW